MTPEEIDRHTEEFINLLRCDINEVVALAEYVEAHRRPGWAQAQRETTMLRLWDEGWALAQIGRRVGKRPQDVGRTLRACGVQVVKRPGEAVARW